MKNHQYIRQELPVKELAKLLVRHESVNTGDEGLDGEWEDFYDDFYYSPDGLEFWSYEDAIDHTVDWLNSDYKKEEWKSE